MAVYTRIVELKRRADDYKLFTMTDKFHLPPVPIKSPELGEQIHLVVPLAAVLDDVGELVGSHDHPATQHEVDVILLLVHGD